MTFDKDDFVYLRVTPLKGMQWFHVRGKLSPCYIGPFRIIARRGEVAYQLELPPKLKDFHDVFHVTMPRKYLQVPETPNAFPQIDHKSIDLSHDMSYRERPLCILEEDVRQTRRRKIKFYKVQWTNHTPEEATWEREEYLRTEFPDFLPSQE